VNTNFLRSCETSVNVLLIIRIKSYLNIFGIILIIFKKGSLQSANYSTLDVSHIAPESNTDELENSEVRILIIIANLIFQRSIIKTC
jgi:hypothetical protein